MCLAESDAEKQISPKKFPKMSPEDWFKPEKINEIYQDGHRLCFISNRPDVDLRVDKNAQVTLWIMVVPEGYDATDLHTPTYTRMLVHGLTIECRDYNNLFFRKRSTFGLNDYDRHPDYTWKVESTLEEIEEISTLIVSVGSGFDEDNTPSDEMFLQAA